MLSVDTNVLVRYFVAEDDPKQSEKARKLIVGQPTFFPITVLLETEWVLRAKYRVEQGRIMAAFLALAGIPSVTLEARGAVIRAIRWTSDAGLEFADALHLALSNDVEAFVTFDRDFAKRGRKLDGVQVRLL